MIPINILVNVTITAQVQLPPLTLADIERMIDGINQGMSYNDQGFEAGPGDTIITIDDLLRAPIDPTGTCITNLAALKS